MAAIRQTNTNRWTDLQKKTLMDCVNNAPNIQTGILKAARVLNRTESACKQQRYKILEDKALWNEKDSTKSLTKQDILSLIELSVKKKSNLLLEDLASTIVTSIKPEKALLYKELIKYMK